MNFKKVRLWIILILLGIFATYEVYLYLFLDNDPKYLRIDRCIDSGGCWDGIDKTCRKSELNAQGLCDRHKVNEKTLEERINEKIEKINPEN